MQQNRIDKWFTYGWRAARNAKSASANPGSTLLYKYWWQDGWDAYHVYAYAVRNERHRRIRNRTLAEWLADRWR